MFYNENNWNLMSRIIYELLQQQDIDRKIGEFKTLEETERGGIVDRVAKCLEDCGFSADTEAEAFECLVRDVGTSPFGLMEALCYIDMKMHHENQADIFMQDKTSSVSPMRRLNTNEEELGIALYPRLLCDWSRKEKGDTFKELSASKGINELMEHYYYINAQKLGEYKVQNYVIRDMGKKESSEFIRIAVSPLTNADILEVQKYTSKDKKNRIAVSGVGSDNTQRPIEPEYYADENMLADRVKKTIDAAIDAESDILMFTEMLGTEKSRAAGLERLAKQDCLSAALKKQAPPLITLLPTEWICRDKSNMSKPWESGNNINELPVACRGKLMDGEGYKETFRQQKQNPYVEETGRLQGAAEDILSDRQIYLLHVPHLGRVAFPICADLLTPDYRKLLIEELGATLILCPSFSKGCGDFIQIINSGVDFGCHIVWCNSCAVRHLYDGDSKGVFQGCDICCAGVGGGRECAPIKPNPVCMGECGQYCLFYIDIPLASVTAQKVMEKPHWEHLTA